VASEPQVSQGKISWSKPLAELRSPVDVAHSTMHGLPIDHRIALEIRLPLRTGKDGEPVLPALVEVSLSIIDLMW